MYQVVFETDAKKEFEKLDRFEQEKIFKQVSKLEINPHYYSKKMRGSKLWSLKVGISGHRLILTIDENTQRVGIVFIGKRKNVYRNF